MAHVIMSLTTSDIDEAKKLSQVLDFWWMMQGKSAFSDTRLDSIQILNGTEVLTKKLVSEQNHSDDDDDSGAAGVSEPNDDGPDSGSPGDVAAINRAYSAGKIADQRGEQRLMAVA